MTRTNIDEKGIAINYKQELIKSVKSLAEGLVIIRGLELKEKEYSYLVDETGKTVFYRKLTNEGFTTEL